MIEMQKIKIAGILGKDFGYLFGKSNKNPRLCRGNQ